MNNQTCYAALLFVAALHLGKDAEDLAHTGHRDRHALVVYANRARVRSPAAVAPIQGLIPTVALAAEATNLLVEDLAGQQPRQLGVVLQQVEFDVESALEHLAQQVRCLWRKSAVCRIVLGKLCFQERFLSGDEGHTATGRNLGGN